MLQGLTTGLALAVVVWTLLPLLRHDAWWVRMHDFPRVQITLIGTGVLAAHASLAGWRDPADAVLLLALAACVLFQLAHIVRYTPWWPKQVLGAQELATGAAGDDTLALMVANVLTPNRRAQDLVDLVRERRPDVLLTVETDGWWEAQLRPLEADYPHRVHRPQDNLYGMHLYSRLPLVDPQVHCLVEDGVPSIHAGVRLRNGRVVTLHGLHPSPPAPSENPSSTERDAELLRVAKALPQPARAEVVMGDLNDVAWSATTRLFQKIGGLLDPRVGRGSFNTFHAKLPFLRWPLDHVFCSPDFTLMSMARLRAIGSDHFPIEVVLRLAPEAADVHETPRADAEDHAQAREKLRRAGVDPAAPAAAGTTIEPSKGPS